MSPEQTGLLIVQFAISCMVLLVIAFKAVNAREQRHAYRLFALRDRLIYMLAVGQLAEDEFLFKVLYSALTRGIGELDNLTVYAFVKASISAKSELEAAQEEKFKEAIDSADPNMREFVRDFAVSMMDIMRANSPILNLTLFAVRWCGKAIKSVRNFATPSAQETYRTYQFFQGIEHTVTTHSAIPVH